MPYDARGLVHAIKGLGRALAHRTDAWSNEYSGLGTARDKSTLSKLVYGRLFRPEFLDWVYVESDMARTIVSAIVEDAMREGYELRRRGEDEPDLEAAKRAKEACDAAGVGEAVHEAAVWGRLHGRAAVLVLAQGEQDSPLPERARVIDLLVVDKGELVPYAWYEDPLAPKFGQVEVYAYTPISGGPVSEAVQYVHESRLVLFGGLLTPKRIKQINEGSDVSVLQPVYDLLKKEGGVFDSMCAIVADMSQGVIKMKGLIDAIAAGKSDNITTRITLMDQMRSVTRSILLDAEDEDFKYVERGTASGVGDLIDKVWVRIAKAADMPVTRLMGVSPAGLNATGESDRKFWYDKVRSYQRKILAPAIERLVRLVTGQDYEVCFPDLEKPTQLEQAQEQQAVAATDGAYIDRGVLTPSEVAMVRFGKGHWTPGFDGIDMEAHEMALDREQDELANPPEPESADPDGTGAAGGSPAPGAGDTPTDI